MALSTSGKRVALVTGSGKVDMVALDRALMEEAIKKFGEPQMTLLALIAKKRSPARRDRCQLQKHA